MSCGISDRMIARKMSRRAGVEHAEIDEAEHARDDRADHVHVLAADPVGEMAEERDREERQDEAASTAVSRKSRETFSVPVP
jgi:hypothetical protein